MVQLGRFCIQNAIPINIYSFELTNSYISELSYEVWRAIYTIIQNYFHVQPSISRSAFRTTRGTVVL